MLVDSSEIIASQLLLLLEAYHSIAAIIRLLPYINPDHNSLPP